jgi:hypothetical protein
VTPDFVEAIAALDALQSRVRQTPESRRAEIAMQMNAMTEFAFASAEGVAPGFRARFERLHAEFVVLMGVES